MKKPRQLVEVEILNTPETIVDIIQDPITGVEFKPEIIPGIKGTTFIPDVSSEGIISWTNDGNLPNPDPVNIMGPEGSKGEPGVGIVSVEKINSRYTDENVRVDTYRITFTDGHVTDFEIVNGMASTNYNSLTNKPSINNITLEGNSNLEDLNIQSKLTSENAGDGISIVTNQQGKVIISNTQTSAEWGNITGNITDQADLINYISAHGGTYAAGNGIDITNNVISIEEGMLIDCGTSTTVIT